MKALILANQLITKCIGVMHKDDLIVNEAATELRRLAEVNAELLAALENIAACDFSHLIPSEFLDPALEIIAKAKEQQ